MPRKTPSLLSAEALAISYFLSIQFKANYRLMYDLMYHLAVERTQKGGLNVNLQEIFFEALRLTFDEIPDAINFQSGPFSYSLLHRATWPEALKCLRHYITADTLRLRDVNGQTFLDRLKSAQINCVGDQRNVFQKMIDLLESRARELLGEEGFRQLEKEFKPIQRRQKRPTTFESDQFPFTGLPPVLYTKALAMITLIFSTIESNGLDAASKLLVDIAAKLNPLEDKAAEYNSSRMFRTGQAVSSPQHDSTLSGWTSHR